MTTPLARPVFTIGQLVRFVGRSGTINHGTVGIVERMDDVLTSCPVVWFPHTLGPYATFVITRPTADLKPVDPCLCPSTTTGTWYGQGHDADCVHAR